MLVSVLKNRKTGLEISSGSYTVNYISYQVESGYETTMNWPIVKDIIPFARKGNKHVICIALKRDYIFEGKKKNVLFVFRVCILQSPAQYIARGKYSINVEWNDTLNCYSDIISAFPPHS